MYKIDPRFPPHQFQASSYSPVIIINRLSKEDKHSLWQHLKDNHPEKASNLTSVMSDPFAQLIMDKKEGLGALLAVDLKYAPESLKNISISYRHTF